jgi:hypothetical protein
MSERPDYLISACTYESGDIELTFEHCETHEKAFLTITRDEDVGGQLLKVIGPCVYYRAQFKDLEAKLEDAEKDSKRVRDLQAWLVDQLPEVLGHGDPYQSGREDAFALALDKLEEQSHE